MSEQQDDPAAGSHAAGTDHLAAVSANANCYLASRPVGCDPSRSCPSIELAALAGQLRAAGVGLEFLTGELQGSHDPSGVVFTVLAALSGMEREYIRDRTLDGHESARARGQAIGGAAVTDDAMLAFALHLRGQELSLRDIAARLVIAAGKKEGQHLSPATVLRMLCEHDEKTAAAAALPVSHCSPPHQRCGTTFPPLPGWCFIGDAPSGHRTAAIQNLAPPVTTTLMFSGLRSLAGFLASCRAETVRDRVRARQVPDG
ncbi:MAG: recombinase family protein [Actinomycetota bacterium]|nr:recombinase family protein [Actinomycetota bacterium]